MSRPVNVHHMAHGFCFVCEPCVISTPAFPSKEPGTSGFKTTSENQPARLLESPALPFFPFRTLHDATYDKVKQHVR
ncbi:hypothetical protein DPMN_186943 [Dreissena polymorpha]|uniref:Uncharacterized protein n=1 Tax=Dreissena polymorpha TaxID=45954 RepID=A0A9D4DME5_DREPO|nr:hypothetical protein DPMN_186943 [Dreissena polymorpha]